MISDARARPPQEDEGPLDAEDRADRVATDPAGSVAESDGAPSRNNVQSKPRRLREPTPSELAEADSAYQDVRKSPGIAYAFWFFLGLFGGHRFYLGDIRQGVAMLLTLGGFGFWALADVFFIGSRLEEINAERRRDVFESRGLKSGLRLELAPPSPTLVWTTRALAVLLVLLLAGAGFLLFTRSEPSSVTTADYVQVLQEARADIVDFTSFDYLTLDDDIRQIRRVALGDLAEEAADRLDGSRQDITEAEAVVNTEIVAAGVTRADADDATVLMVIQTTRRTNQSQQAQVVKYRIEVELKKSGDRWLLNKITGA